MDSLEGQQLMRKSCEVVEANIVLEDKKILCFYFSAHWCPPCRNFTPILADFYSVRTVFVVNSFCQESKMFFAQLIFERNLNMCF